jgi:hypothetical protein
MFHIFTFLSFVCVENLGSDIKEWRYVEGFVYSFNARFGAVYGPLIPHMPLTSVHHKVVNAFQSITNLKSLRVGSILNLNPSSRKS